jgi:prepilin-type N-terminal cleavage/methylation domain-containing protein
MFKHKKGFTLIELLIVIAIIAILAAIIFVALNPLKRFQDSRDAVRWDEIAELANAINLDQVDNGGTYLTAIDDMVEGRWYMIVDGQGNNAMTNGCDDNNADCDVNVYADSYCVDLDGLTEEGYLADVPVSQSGGDVVWDTGEDSGDEGTGYALMTSSSGAIFVQACESENLDEIMVAR